MKEAVIYLLAMTIAEVVTAVIHPVKGIASHIPLLYLLPPIFLPGTQ